MEILLGLDDFVLILFIFCVVQLDLFFYREPEEPKQLEDDEAGPQADFGLPAPEYGVSGGEWTTAQIPDAAWPGEAQAPIAAAPAGSWNDDGGKFC